MFSRLFLIGSFSYLQVMRTYIKAYMSLNFGQIPPLTTELAALERLKNRCRHVISVDIDLIFFKLAGNKDIHNIMNEFKFRPDRTTDYGVSCPWVSKKYPYRPYNGENGVSTFSLLFLIGSFWYFHVTRTSIKAWMSLNFLKWDLTLAHWTQVSDRCPLGYLFVSPYPISPDPNLKKWKKKKFFYQNFYFQLCWTVCCTMCYLRPVMRKPVFEVFNQVRLKPAYSATETSKSLEILDLASIGIILSKQRTTKALIRLCGCAGWSAPLLFPYSKSRFWHDMAYFIFHLEQFPRLM